MTLFFSRFLSVSCLLLVLLGGCSSPESVPQKHAVQQTPQITPSVPAPNTMTSRLDNQPWPPGMGQPLPPNYYNPRTQQPAPQVAPLAPVMPPASGKIQVAILLPLSGKNAALGQAMLNAAQLAVFDVAANNFELMPRDTNDPAGEQEGSATFAARDAIASGAQLLIGPLFASDVTAIKPVVQSSGVNMLALSTDTSLASPGVFVMGFAPAAQVERVVDFSHNQGSHNFAALIPRGAYGDLVARAFQNSVTHSGGVIIAMERFDAARGDSEKHVQALAAKRDQIDTLFLPIGGADLNVIASELVASGFDNQKIHLLGTGLWDVPDLGHNAFLVGGWYAATDPASRQNFLSNYSKTYGSEPPRLATLAYDATALAGVLAKRGARFDYAALTNPNGFAGVDGIFRLNSQGLVERGLAINEITPEGDRLLDAAPTTFAAMTY